MAKAYADLITIAGYDGSPGEPALLRICRLPVGARPGGNPAGAAANGLRFMIRLQVDGGLNRPCILSKRRFLGAERASV